MVNLSSYKIQNIPIKICFTSPSKLQVAEVRVASCESQRIAVPEGHSITKHKGGLPVEGLSQNTKISIQK